MSEMDLDRTRDKDYWISEYQLRIGELKEQIRKLKGQTKDFESDLAKHGQICMKVGIDKGKRIAAQECLEIFNDYFNKTVNTEITNKFGLEKS